MKRCRIVIDPRARMMLASHMRFLAGRNKEAARKLKSEFSSTIREIQDFPLKFPIDADSGKSFRNALFGR